MYIKSIVLDGFKSYGNRVEVTGFDPEFNAITGLNGTGKSNILDSICFVLGITNLSNVRAGTLQDLIYKHGQAGITKGTVSITFDNRDKRQSPIGYENHDEITVTRQVILGGKNKYLINGINVQNKRVSDLFCSVQLNVNNPHFLIMQGRITKVLNMKPPEILSMVEEAAGTRMYEAKKQAAEKTIERKDAKMRELNDIIREDIAPKLQKLQDERSQFQEYQKVVRELENLTRLYVAWNFVTTEEMAKEVEKKITEVKDDIKSRQENMKSNEVDIKDLDKQVVELNKRLDEESGSALKQLQEELHRGEREEATATAARRGAADALAAQRGRARLLRAALADDGRALGERRAALARAERTFAELRAASAAGGEALARARARFLAVSEGREGASESLQDQLMGRFHCPLRAALADDGRALGERRAALARAERTFAELRAASAAGGEALARARARFLAVSEGREGASESLQDQLMAAKQAASEASTRISQSMMEKNHAEERLRNLEREFQSSSAQYQADQNSIAKHQEEVDKIEAEISKLNFSEERNRELKDTIRSLVASVRSKRDQAENLAAKLQRCDFQYTMPAPNFDKRKVFGKVCRLVGVRDPVHCAALEAAAGSRLYNVVVDSAATSSLLLQRGELRARATIIPLDKICANVVPPDVVRRAQEIGGGAGEVDLALALIEFEEGVRPAVAWVFGNTLVCRELSAARHVTFHPRVRRRCVTLDGDVFDPAGTISGGARQKGNSVLVQLAQLQELEDELNQAETRLSQCQSELNAFQRAAEKYTSLQQRLEMSRHALRVASERVAATAHAQLQREIQALRRRVAELTTAVEHDKKMQCETAAKARELEDKVKDIKGHREREFKKAEEALKKAKEEAEEAGQSWKRREQEFETLQLEVLELEKAVAASEEQLREAQDATERLQDAERDADQQLAAASEVVKELHTKIKKQKAEIASRSGDISRLIQKKESLLKINSEQELKLKELDFNLKELKNTGVEYEKKLASLFGENPWIESERQYFGLAGGAFDFANREASVAGARVAQLRERRDRLQRGLNARAHTLLGKEEEQYQDVMRKKKIVEADRAKLVQVMAELDEKKRRTLAAACEQVNRDFGSIFSALLPGAQARLAPPPGRGVLDGLEVRVGFNGAWKESLGELSGGQRSLVALSLVLAMLLFKPAPLYILDEVDAALDLSHTQNIGQMLKEHFRHSQFIIVSLKDGMFNNANVLFRTRFVDGMSSVQRTVNPRR